MLSVKFIVKWPEKLSLILHNERKKERNINYDIPEDFLPLKQVAMSNLYRVQCSRCIAKLFSSTPRALVLCYFLRKQV